MRRSRKPDAGRAAQADVPRQELAVAHGATSIGMNVFSPNAVVRRLYQSLGYEEISMQMRKSLQHQKTPSTMSARTCKGTMTSSTEGHRRAERQVPVRAAAAAQWEIVSRTDSPSTWTSLCQPLSLGAQGPVASGPGASRAGLRGKFLSREILGLRDL
jgi:hypothetical protein